MLFMMAINYTVFEHASKKVTHWQRLVEEIGGKREQSVTREEGVVLYTHT